MDRLKFSKHEQIKRNGTKNLQKSFMYVLLYIHCSNSISISIPVT